MVPLVAYAAKWKLDVHGNLEIPQVFLRDAAPLASGKAGLICFHSGEVGRLVSARHTLYVTHHLFSTPTF